MSIEHGTLRGYWKCPDKCGPCRKAWNRYTTERRDAREQALLRDPTIAPHGKDSTYNNYRCKCDACKKAHRDAVENRRIRKEKEAQQ